MDKLATSLILLGVITGLFSLAIDALPLTVVALVWVLAGLYLRASDGR